MHRNLSKHASQVKRSVPYYLIFILILGGAVDLLIFSFFPLKKIISLKGLFLHQILRKAPLKSGIVNLSVPQKVQQACWWQQLPTCMVRWGSYT